MNWDQIEGNWKQMKAKVRHQWAKLTDDDRSTSSPASVRSSLGKLQERYGVKREQAERQLDDFTSRL